MTRSFFLVLFFVLCIGTAFAGDPTIWSVNTKDDVLKGDSRGVSIGPGGAISLSPRLAELFKTDQPYVWSSAIDGSGNVYLGTGSDGRVFRVTPAGSGALLANLPELNVTAVAIGRGGEIFAATSPDGKVYRISESGSFEVYFDPGEKYIWSLAVMADGSLAVGTGETGKIFRVRSANAAPAASLLFDTSETHIITLATDAQGNLYAGTDSNGLVLRFGADGRPFALLDSPLREIHELAVGRDGSVYALAVSESVSSATPSPTATPESTTVSVERPNPAAQPPQQKSRYDLTGAKSAVYRILPSGGYDIIWSSAGVTGFSLLPRDGGVLLGTSDKGRIYQIGNDGSETLLLQSEAGQISTIMASGKDIIATSSNQGMLYRFGPETIAEGTYLSPVLDAKTSSSWGRIWWRSVGNVAIETRSGNTASPDESWSQWESVRGEGTAGKVPSPMARFLQWRAVLRGTTSATTLSEVNVAFLNRNIAPEVLSVTVLPVNVGLLANPAMQIDPNIEISGMDPAVFGLQIQPVPPRRAFQRGAIAFQWTAEDRNGDKLVYDIYYKEVGEAEYKLLQSDTSETFYTLDGLSLADGRYTVKIVAKDSPSNPTGSYLKGERVSEPFLIDNTQPTVTVVGQPTVTGDRARVVFQAIDRSSYLVRAEYSVNGGAWRSVYADDGISDSPEERYTVETVLPAAGEYSITIRVFDAAGNIGNARAIVRR